MFSKFGAYFDLLRKGSEVADVEKWKNRQIKGTMLSAFIIAIINLAKAYGYDLPVSVDDANNIGLGIIAVVNILLTATTSKRAGLLPAKPTTVVEPAVPGEATEPVQSEVQPAVTEPADSVRPVSHPFDKEFDRDIYIG